MLYFITSNRHIRSRLEGFIKQEEALFFTSVIRMENACSESTDPFSVIIDENLSSGEVSSFLLRQKNNPRLEHLILLAGSGPDVQTSFYDSRLSVIRKDYLVSGLASVLARAPHTSDKRTSSIIGSSALMRKLRHDIDRAGRSRCNVIICGETGSGKELVAREIHHSIHSNRAPVVNCALLNSDLLESTLFGHKAGAFSGAISDQKGLVEEADGNSLILDEIEELSVKTQAKLLRFLDSGEYSPLGDRSVRHSNCRIIAITNRPVSALYRENLLRKDFYMRIAGATIQVPPLKAHLEDMEELVRAREKEKGYRDHIKDIDSLKTYSWPGNVRELFHCIDRLHMNGLEETDLGLGDIVSDPCFQYGEKPYSV